MPVYSLGSERQGIVHVIGPELGVTQPGMTIVCGDSHTSTHGAFGALAFGIGTSEVEHVLATQCMVQHKPRSMRILYDGQLGFGVTAKDLILGTLGRSAWAASTGHVVEYAGAAIEALSMEGRMTVCNMTIEGGGRAGMIAPDETTFAWFSEVDRPGAPKGGSCSGRSPAGASCAATRARPSTRGHDRRERDLAPGHVGNQPRDGRRRHRGRARARGVRQPADREATERALQLHGPASRARRSSRSRSTACSSARARTRGSATCAPPPRSSQGRKVADGVDAMVVPGSQQVKAQAEPEGLDDVFREAGFDWRGAGCSMCLGMNPDIAGAGRALRLHLATATSRGARAAAGARTSSRPQMAAAAAIEGHFVDIRDWAR